MAIRRKFCQNLEYVKNRLECKIWPAPCEYRTKNHNKVVVAKGSPLTNNSYVRGNLIEENTISSDVQSRIQNVFK